MTTREALLSTRELQRSVLFYDRILAAQQVTRSAAQDARNPAVADLKYLREAGVVGLVGAQVPNIVFGFSGGGELRLHDLQDCDLRVPSRALHPAEELYLGEPLEDRRVRTLCRSMQLDDGELVLKLSSAPSATPPAETHLLEVALLALPLPPDNIPWEDLLAYRQDAEQKAALQALRCWMRRLARGASNATDLQDELRFALDNYRRVAESAHSRTKLEDFATVLLLGSIVASADTSPYIALAEACAGLITVRARRPDPLLQAFEPGREVAYIHNTERWLRSQQR